MAMPDPPSQEELQDLIDGRLEGARLREVHGYLARDAEMAEFVQRLRRTDAELRKLGRDMLNEPLPEDLRRFASPERPAVPKRPGWRLRLEGAGLAVACLLLLVIGSGAGWWARVAYDDPGERMVARMVSDMTSYNTYVQSADYMRLDFPADDQELFSKWASEAFGVGFEPPDLSDQGYDYVGARVLPSAERTGSLLAYRSGDTLISIYYWKDSALPGDLPSMFEHAGHEVRFKREGPLVVAIVAPEGIEDFNSTAADLLGTFADIVSVGNF